MSNVMKPAVIVLAGVVGLSGHNVECYEYDYGCKLSREANHPEMPPNSPFGLPTPKIAMEQGSTASTWDVQPFYRSPTVYWLTT